MRATGQMRGAHFAGMTISTRSPTMQLEATLTLSHSFSISLSYCAAGGDADKEGQAWRRVPYY